MSEWTKMMLFQNFAAGAAGQMQSGGGEKWSNIVKANTPQQDGSKFLLPAQIEAAKDRKMTRQMFRETQDNFIQNRVADGKKAGLSALASIGAPAASPPSFSSGIQNTPSAPKDNNLAAAVVGIFDAMNNARLVDQQIQMMQLQQAERHWKAGVNTTDAVRKNVLDSQNWDKGVLAKPVETERLSEPVPLPGDSTTMHHLNKDGRPAIRLHSMRLLGEPISLYLPTQEVAEFYESPAMWIEAYADPRNKQKIEQHLLYVWNKGKQRSTIVRLADRIYRASPGAQLAKWLKGKGLIDQPANKGRRPYGDNYWRLNP